MLLTLRPSAQRNQYLLVTSKKFNRNPESQLCFPFMLEVVLSDGSGTSGITRMP